VSLSRLVEVVTAASAAAVAAAEAEADDDDGDSDGDAGRPPRRRQTRCDNLDIGIIVTAAADLSTIAAGLHGRPLP